MTDKHDNWVFGAAEHIREAVEMVEAYAGNQEQGTRRHAELQLAWHNLMRAHGLLMIGEPTPDDLVWGSVEADKIINTAALKARDNPTPDEM